MCFLTRGIQNKKAGHLAGVCVGHVHPKLCAKGQILCFLSATALKALCGGPLCGDPHRTTFDGPWQQKNKQYGGILPGP